MPQLDYTTFAAQLFWLALTFSLLYIVLSRVTLPVIRDVLQARQDRISHDLEKAELARQEAEAAKQEYTEALKKARNSAATALAEVSASLKREAAKQHSALDAELASQAVQAEKRLESLKKDAQAELLPVSVMLAEVIAKKLMGKTIATDAIQALIAPNQQQ